MIPLQHTLQDSLTVRERPTCRVRRRSNPRPSGGDEMHFPWDIG
jgi:hypothetical protein